MSGIFEALPGVDVPVASISKGLSQMWEGNASQGKPSPGQDHAKAIQVNFVLHLGLKTDSADAVVQFETAVKFSRRYPCRVVVLCPISKETGAMEIKAKVYGECTVGKTPEDTRCCEFVMLSYPRAARAHLENQVSICLSTDIPLYYWAHRFSEAAKLADYKYLLNSAKRVLIDSATAPADAFGFAWPKPQNVRDLAFARLLPVRQAVGQFLSRYPAKAIAEGLASVELSHGAELGSEAKVLLAWLRDRIQACGGLREIGTLVASPALGPRELSLTFGYQGKKAFKWTADLAEGHSAFDADFGTGRTQMPASAALLSPENALSEAMFF
jgi:glucose-6-phosphate dehydrogenase assembly protein OpcA